MLSRATLGALGVAAVAVLWYGTVNAALAAPWDARGKTVLISGASSGIGKALAMEYCAAGARLLLTARRAAQLEEVKAACVERGATEAHIIPADVGEAEGWAKVGAALHQVFAGAPLDLLVLNAGLSMGNTFEDLHNSHQAMAVTEQLMRVNYIGAIGLLDQALPAMLRSESGVRVAVISSLAGLMPAPYRTAYCASKHALHGFFDAWRMELLEHPAGSHVTMIAPGLVQTNINEGRAGTNNNTVHLNMNIAVPVDQAAARMRAAIAQGQRQLVFELDTTLKGRVLGLNLLGAVRMVAPEFLDRIVARTANAVMNK